MLTVLYKLCYGFVKLKVSKYLLVRKFARTFPSKPKASNTIYTLLCAVIIRLFFSSSPFVRVIFSLFQYNFFPTFCKILRVDLLSFREAALIFLRSFFLIQDFSQFLHSWKSVHHNICQLDFQTKPQMYIPKYLINPRQLC